MYRSRSGIYQILNSVNRKRYIGSAVNLKSRINLHIYQLRKNIHVNNRLQSDWNKYGEKSFDFKVVAFCARDVLIPVEQGFLDHYASVKTGYNIAPKAGSNAGFHHSVEARLKIALAHVGMRHTKEAKARMSKERRGIKLSVETRRRMSLSKLGNTNAAGNKNHLGHKHSAEARDKMSVGIKLWHKEHKNPFLGRHHSEESRARMSLAHRGKKLSFKTRRKMSLRMLGKRYSLGYHHTEEAKRRIGRAAKGNKYSLGYHHTQRARKAISDGNKGRLRKTA